VKCCLLRCIDTDAVEPSQGVHEGAIAGEKMPCNDVGKLKAFSKLFLEVNMEEGGALG
jgi:hypothetical protein